MLKGMKLPCIVTGKLSYFSKSSLEKKVSKFGSVDEVAKHYICPPARKLLRSGMTVDQVREKLNVTADVPKVEFETLSRLGLLKKNNHRRKKADSKWGMCFWRHPDYIKTKAAEERAREKFNEHASDREYIEWSTGGPAGSQVPLGGTCQRPDIFLNNGKYCDGCSYWEYCLCDKKRVTRDYQSNS